jgi:hypothetical protein
MKYLFIMVAFLFFSSVKAKSTSGNDLLLNCHEFIKYDQGQTHNSEMHARCISYIKGAFDSFYSLKGYLKKGEIQDVCIPVKVTENQIVRVVYIYLSNHSSKLKQSGSSVVILALIDKFPCRNKQK